MRWEEILIVAAILGSGLIAGVFFAFSTFVMGALARIPAAQGIAAMQAINVVVINPWFLGAFFGTALVSLAAIVVGIARWSGMESALPVGGGVLYLVGTFSVTVAANVPLNNELARVDPETGGEVWSRYLRVWTAWNHVRTIAAALATVCFALGAVL